MTTKLANETVTELNIVPVKLVVAGEEYVKVFTIAATVCIVWQLSVPSELATSIAFAAKLLTVPP